MSAADEDGSILPLILGYVVLALATVIVCVCATDLYIAQKRLDSLADAAALAGAQGFVLDVSGDTAQASLSSDDVREQASAIVDAVGAGAELVDAVAVDNVSARVTVASAWHPPIFSIFVPDGVALQSTGTSRTALQ